MNKRNLIIALLIAAIAAPFLFARPAAAAPRATRVPLTIQHVSASVAAAPLPGCTTTLRNPDYQTWTENCASTGTYIISTDRAVMMDIHFIGPDDEVSINTRFTVNGITSVALEEEGIDPQGVEFESLWVGPGGKVFHVNAPYALGLSIYAYTTSEDVAPVVVTVVDP